MKVRMFFIVLIVAAAISSIFLYYSNRTNEALLATARMSYIYELRAVVQDFYLIQAGVLTNFTIAEVEERANDLLNEASPLYQYVTALGENDGALVSEIKSLHDLALSSKEAVNNPETLAVLRLRAADYPTKQTYSLLLENISDSIGNLERNRWVTVGGLIAAMAILFFALQMIAKGVGMIAGACKAVADAADTGVLDISKRVYLTVKDETKVITDNLNHFFEVLEQNVAKTLGSVERAYYQSQKMYGESEGSALEIQVINSSVDRMNRQISVQMASVSEAAAALEEMERTLDVIFNNISRQSSAMTESAATLEEMGRQIEGIASISNETSDLAKNLTRAAEKGSGAVDSSIVSIRDVAEYSGQIIKLLKLITDIAKQTNLLAMNASIEAAHAGEAGRGFAIVAEEIRRLSETTNKNAKEIRTVVDTMVEKIENSVGQVQVAGEDLASITKFAGNVDERVAQLNGMLQEQNTATQETIQTIENLVTLAQEIKLSMEEQQYALNEYSTTMNSLRDNFTDTESTLHSHTSSVDNLLQIMTGTRSRIAINQSLMEAASKILTSFVVNKALLSTGEQIAQEQDSYFAAEHAKAIKTQAEGGYR